jgi:hypothetical protein
MERLFETAGVFSRYLVLFSNVDKDVSEQRIWSITSWKSGLTLSNCRELEG